MPWSLGNKSSSRACLTSPLAKKKKKRILLVSSISEDVDDENIREYNNDDNLSIVGQ